VLLADLAPGRGGSAPSGLKAVGEHLFFKAQDNQYGRQLWILDHQVPTADFLAPERCRNDRRVTLDASASSTAEGSVITSYQWDLGDESAADGPVVEHEYAAGTRGTVRVCLTVTNDLGFSSTVCRDLCFGLRFLRGDSNSDGGVNISDPINTLNALFSGGDRAPCFDAADANDDSEINITDPLRTLSFLFGSGDPLPGGPDCSLDLTADDLTCEDNGHCPGE
jgi:hypothetical protein